MELWAYDLKTRTKKQILPEELTKKQGAPKVWVGTDGNVYGSAGGVSFRCWLDRVEMGPSKGRRRSNAHRTAGSKVVWGIREDGALTMTDLTDRSEVKVPTTYPGTGRQIFCVACERDGKIYGGTISPAHAFSYDTETGRLEDLGRLTGGRVQIYDILSHPKGLFMASYVGAHLDFYDPGSPRKPGVNPRLVASLSRDHMQERPVQIVEGPHGMLYAGTIPVKGHLGGALARVSPTDLNCKVWRDPIPNLSLYCLAAVPETGELVCTTSVRGGSRAKPTEKEACVFLWDTQKEEVAFQCKPVPGAKHYGCVTRAKNGLVYGLAGRSYYALDPQSREVVSKGELPVKRVRYPGLHDSPVGPEGLILGIGDDAIFAINPKDHRTSVLGRDASLKYTHGFYVTQDGTVYYGSRATLMRAKPATR